MDISLKGYSILKENLLQAIIRKSRNARLSPTAVCELSQRILD